MSTNHPPGNPVRTTVQGPRTTTTTTTTTSQIPSVPPGKAVNPVATINLPGVQTTIYRLVSNVSPFEYKEVTPAPRSIRKLTPEGRREFCSRKEKIIRNACAQIDKYLRSFREKEASFPNAGAEEKSLIHDMVFAHGEITRHFIVLKDTDNKLMPAIEQRSISTVLASYISMLSSIHLRLVECETFLREDVGANKLEQYQVRFADIDPDDPVGFSTPTGDHENDDNESGNGSKRSNDKKSKT